jgi:hypothetical protein
VVSFAAMVLSWRPPAWRTATATLDPSWQAGLAEGFEHHLQWGPALVFTFGPYGLVDTILPFYRSTTLLAVLFAVAVSWGLAALVVVALRPSWGILAAGVAAWAVIAVGASKTGYSDLSSATSLGLALAVITADHERDRVRLVLLALLGALAGFQLLAKFNYGLLGLGLVVVVVALSGLPRPKAALVGGAPLVGVALAAWLGAGQSLGHVGSYLRGSLSVATGYSSAMSVATGRWHQDVYAVVVVLLIALVLGLAARSGPRRQQVAVAVVLGGWTWAIVKEGFVRHDTHDLTFFGLALVALALARVRRAYVPIQAGALVVAMIAACGSAGGVPEQLHSPGASTVAFAREVQAVAGLGGFSRAQANLRAQLLSTGDALSPPTLALLVGKTVAFEPIQASIAYVYPQLDWDPEPVLQGYSAYTSYLDGENASFLASARAPQRIVYQAQDTIDNRDPWLDPPATLESMYCHYVQVAVSGPSQVLAHVPGPVAGPGRCGRPAVLGRVKTTFGRAVAVPADPGHMVTAALSFGTPLITSLEGLVTKPPHMQITVWARPSGLATTYRFIPGTAGDTQVLRVPAALGYSPSFTPPPIAKLELTGGGWSKGQGALTVTFYAVALRPS